MVAANDLAFSACGLSQQSPGSCSGYLEVVASGPVIPSGYVQTQTEEGFAGRSEGHNVKWVPVDVVSP